MVFLSVIKLPFAGGYQQHEGDVKCLMGSAIGLLILSVINIMLQAVISNMKVT
jgi:hypothetical protein